MTTIGIDGINRTFKGLSELVFYNLRTNIALNLPKPSDFNIIKNYSQKRLVDVTDNGETAYSGVYIDGQDPQLQIIYTQWQPEIMGLKMGTIFQEATKSLNMSKSIDAYRTGVDLPLNVGDDLTLTSLVSASYTVNNQSVDVSGLITLNLANKTVNFDPSLAGKRVSFRFTADVTGALSSTGDRENEFAVSATLITTANEIVIVDIARCAINFEGAAFTPKSEQIDLNFFIPPIAGTCDPVNYTFTNNYINCAV
jgi:hypothetical protein